LTAKWEQKLENIKEGRLQEQSFTKEIMRYTAKLVDEVKQSQEKYVHDNITKTRCPNCDKYMLEVSGKKGLMLVCQDRECGYRKHLTTLTNARCPECRKQLEIVGEGEKRKFVCKCGYRETLEAFEKRMADQKSVLSKQEVQNYLQKQKKEEQAKNESPLAVALKKAMEEMKTGKKS
jgi:DNA topoisomerase-3